MLLVFNTGALHAQSVRGRVVEDSTGEPLAGVLVEAVNASAAASTDLTGTFVLQLPRAGLYRLRTTLAGYAATGADTVRVAEDLTTVLLHMKRTTIPLAPVNVQAESRGRATEFYERMRSTAGMGQFITRADILERQATSRITELLRGVSGIEIVPVRRPRSASTINTIVMSGGPTGRCTPSVYIDGSLVKQFPESGIDDFLKPDMIEGVEVYARSASAPAQFGAPMTCGVVAFWTRTGSGEGAEKWTFKRAVAAATVSVALVLLLRLAR